MFTPPKSLLTNILSYLYQITVKNDTLILNEYTTIFNIILKCLKNIFDPDAYNYPPLSPPRLRDVRLEGFGILSISRIGYLGEVFDLEFQTLKYSFMYVFSKE